jgi:hypothetical protein
MVPRAWHITRITSIRMKRCALIISDNAQFRRWLGCQITTKWPKMLVEYCCMSRTPAFLDRSAISRYHLIVVRLGWQASENLHACIMLLRILSLDTHPEIVIIANSSEELDPLRSTNLNQTTTLLARSVTSEGISNVLDDICARQGHQLEEQWEGAPDIPGYRIVDPITATYGATIYRAFSEHLGFDVALKIRELAKPTRGVSHGLTLLQEFEVLRKLGGNYIGRVFDYGEIDTIAYMAMEYLPHGHLERYFTTAGRRASRIHCMLHLAKGIREIHNAGYLHLDIKPNNVLVRDEGTPVLIDFGICRRIVEAQYEDRRPLSMGSPYYMSPEQFCGDPVDVRSDIYSFGAVWYRVFTGQVPYCDRALDKSTIYEFRKGPPSLGDALRRYQPIIDHTLVADRDKRFTTAQELIDSIRYCWSRKRRSDDIGFHSVA